MSETKVPVRRHRIVTAVEPASVASRTETLVKTGTKRLVAEAIAKRAAEEQALRDEGLKREIEIKTRALKETVAATSLKGTSAPKANAPTVVPVPALEDTTIDKLRTFALEHGLEISPDIKLKGDLHTAITTAHAAKFPVA